MKKEKFIKAIEELCANNFNSCLFAGTYGMPGNEDVYATIFGKENDVVRGIVSVINNPDNMIAGRQLRDLIFNTMITIILTSKKNADDFFERLDKTLDYDL